MEDKKMLNNEELEKVSGGGGKNGRTEMHCGNCHYFSIWSGYYVHQYFNCPKCGAEKAFVGFKFLEK